MDIEDIILIILLVASVTFNICMYYRNKWLAYKLEKAKRKFLQWKADLVKQDAAKLIEQSEEKKNENNKRKNETK